MRMIKTYSKGAPFYNALIKHLARNPIGSIPRAEKTRQFLFTPDL